MLSVTTPDTDAALAEEWPSPSNTTIAASDIVDGLGRSWMWFALAMQDIKLRYRGSLLGPFWLTISTLIMTVAMGLIFSRLFHQDLKTYMPFLLTGLVTWQFVLASINEGCQTFLTVGSIIQQVPMPFSVHAYRVVCRNMIVLAHSFVIIPLVILYFQVPVGWNLLSVIPGLLILSINGVWVAMLLGIICTRFRDVQQIVSNFVQVLFFVTPIFWSPDSLGNWKTLAELNPLFAAVDVVRAPLLGQSPAPYSWLVLLGLTIVGSVATFAFFARFRARIAYWI